MHSEDGKQPNKAKEIMMTHDEMIKVIAAHRDGKEIQVGYKTGTPDWNTTPTPLWNFQEFIYRIKPEPGLRPWKPEEVPVGALYRRKTWTKPETAFICWKSFSSEFSFHLSPSHGYHKETCEEACAFGQWKWPNEPETAWKPCGAEG